MILQVETVTCKMCSHAVRIDEIHVHLTEYCPAQQPNTRINHVVELRKWERKLQEAAIGDTAETSEDFLKHGKGMCLRFFVISDVKMTSASKVLKFTQCGVSVLHGKRNNEV